MVHEKRWTDRQPLPRPIRSLLDDQDEDLRLADQLAFGVCVRPFYSSQRFNYLIQHALSMSFDIALKSLKVPVHT